MMSGMYCKRSNGENWNMDTKLTELAERVEALDYPDSAINEEIAKAVGHMIYDRTYYVCPHYLSSLDDAQSLLDGRALWAVGSMEDGPFARLCWPMPDGGFSGGYFEVKAAAPEFALVAAALRARAALG